MATFGAKPACRWRWSVWTLRLSVVVMLSLLSSSVVVDVEVTLAGTVKRRRTLHNRSSGSF